MRKKPFALSAKNFYIDEQILDYCTNPLFAKHRKFLNDHKYNVGHTNVSYRNVINWEEHDLLPENIREKEGWRKFSLVEVIWLEIIIRLRKFGLGLDKIATTKEWVLQFNNKTQTYDEFEFYIYKALESRLDPYVAVISTGDADMALLPEIANGMNNIGHQDIILISITAIIYGLGLATPEKLDLFNLTEEHRELLSEIHSGENEEVTVKIKSGQMKEMESRSKKLLVTELKKQMREGNFGEIIEKYENGVLQSGQIRKRKRFKK